MRAVGFTSRITRSCTQRRPIEFRALSNHQRYRVADDRNAWLCPTAVGLWISHSGWRRAQAGIAHWPNVHSCGTVPPHGAEELKYPEPDFFTVGMKSCGRAPTFLTLTGYEQSVRFGQRVVLRDDGDDDQLKLRLSVSQTLE